MDRIYIVSGWHDPEGQFQSNEKNLNKLLKDEGWVVKTVTPFSSDGYGYGSVSVASSQVVGHNPNKPSIECSGHDNGFAAIVVLTRD